MKHVDLAQRNKVIVLTDLDAAQCPPSLRREWLDGAGVAEADIPATFTFCIAVCEVEAWVLSDRNSFSDYFAVPSNVIANNVEINISNPKERLLKIMKRSTNKERRTAILPARKSKALVGLGYNDSIVKFIEQRWDPDVARRNSASLQRAIDRIGAA